MITNERQYRISKSQLTNFESALESINAEKVAATEAEETLFRNAIESQLEELRTEIEAYEELVDSQFYFSECDSLEELPIALIKARISQGLTQKELGEKLGVKEQQVQRWEASEYKNISFSKLKAVAAALKLNINCTSLSVSKTETVSAIKAFYKKWGTTTLKEKLLPLKIITGFNSSNQDDLIFACKAFIEIAARIYSYSCKTILDMIVSGFIPETKALGSARFKLFSNSTHSEFGAYVMYVNYVSRIVAHISTNTERRTLVNDPHKLYDLLENEYGGVKFESVLNYVWSCGCIVIPLNDIGKLHGAIWGIDGVPVIILKQRKLIDSIWLFDLLHEIRHAIEYLSKKSFEYLEEHPIDPSRYDSAEEKIANEFAKDTIFRDRLQLIEDEVEALTGGDIKKLKTAVTKTAKKYNVHVGSLANHFAYRLSKENGIEWWGSAYNMQKQNEIENPYEIALNKLYANINLRALNKNDRDVLKKAFAR